MGDTEAVGEGTVSGNQVSIPAHIRERFGIEDGDVLRWRVESGDLRVEILHQEKGVFEGFEPGTSEEPVDAVEEHDGFGVE